MNGSEVPEICWFSEGEMSQKLKGCVGWCAEILGNAFTSLLLNLERLQLQEQHLEASGGEASRSVCETASVEQRRHGSTIGI
jgi:hypothetical protein